VVRVVHGQAAAELALGNHLNAAIEKPCLVNMAKHGDSILLPPYLEFIDTEWLLTLDNRLYDRLLLCHRHTKRSHGFVTCGAASHGCRWPLWPNHGEMKRHLAVVLLGDGADLDGPSAESQLTFRLAGPTEYLTVVLQY